MSKRKQTQSLEDKRRPPDVSRPGKSVNQTRDERDGLAEDAQSRTHDAERCLKDDHKADKVC